MSGTLTARDRQALREAIDAHTRQTVEPEPGLIDFPPTSRLLHGTEPGYRKGCRCHGCTALQHLQAAGADGLTSAELGHAMGVSQTYAKSNGLQWLRALKKKQLARQKKHGIWVAANPDPAADTSLPPGMTDEIPY